MRRLFIGKGAAAVSVVAVLPLLSWLAVASPGGAVLRRSLSAAGLARRLTTGFLVGGGSARRAGSGWLALSPPPPDTTTNRYQPSRQPKPALHDRLGDPFSNPTSTTPLQLTTPDNVKLTVTADDSLKYFDISEQAGDVAFRPPTRMTYAQYTEWQQKQAARNYFRSKAAGLDGESVTTTKRLIPKIYLPPALERIFGGNFVDIRPNGAVTIRAGWRHNRNYNPALPLRQQSVGDFDFDQTIQLSMTGQVGEKLKLNFNYDTKANFNFENQIKYAYTGEETDIIRKLEVGNVSMPLQGSLIQGGQNLFGAKAELQFGNLNVTAVGATVQGSQDEIRIQNGAQTRKFEIRADQYDRDRHYFLSQFFRDRYDAALRSLPLVQSGFQIRRLEVYVTNNSTIAADNLRNVVTLMDLAEPATVFRQNLLPNGPPLNRALANNANRLFELVTARGAPRGNNTIDTYLASQGLLKSRDFEHIRARKLDPREYKFNPQLGTLSLNSTLLPDQVCGVSYEYTFNGRTYKVGELADDYANIQQDQIIFLKMLKATNPSLKYPTWDLMMKNVYSLNASQVTRENFQLNVVYKDDENGVNITSLKEGGSRVENIPLIQVLGADNLNPNNDKPSDGNFDFLPGLTIDPDNGRITFPVVEPFGSFLRKRFESGNPPAGVGVADKYVFQQLYDSVQTQAAQFTQFTKFFLTGKMQQSGSTDEVQLPGIRVVPGSVSVYSGGTRLTEGVDYQVFYDLARLKIINPSYLNSAAELRINVEKEAVIQVQPRRLVGTRLNYAVSKDFTVGGTLMHMIESPLINRVNVGDEPTNNTIYGLDFALRKESRFLTKMLDKLPMIQTKEVSTVALTGEFAQLIPGKTQLRGENGVSYLDDFENAETPYSLGGTNIFPWKLAATPAPLLQGRTGRDAANNRARLAWYSVDQTYYATTNAKPSNIAAGDLKNHYSRGIQRREIYPNRDADLQNGFEYPLDLAFYPDERGQYNYTPDVQTGGDGQVFSYATEPNRLKQNWGGISRGITFDTDFDNANVEYLEFWMLDPFISGENGKIDDQSGHRTPKPNTTGGELYLNLGNVSEDVIKDAARYEFENGLPPDGGNDNVDVTPVARATRLQYLTDAFDTAPGARGNQDIGLDGVKDANEGAYFTAQGAPAAYANLPDPSADNFRHHLDDAYTAADVKILGRYKSFNGQEGNSGENTTRASYAFPDKEDMNRDNVVNDVESYYEYRMRLPATGLDVGGVNGYIVDKVENTVNGDAVTWYLFRIPIRKPTRPVGGISGYKNIRFMRLYMTGWQEPVVLRFNQMRFVANQWRKFSEVISDNNQPCPGCVIDADAFTVSTVNVENNGAVATGEIPYVLPPGIKRDKDVSSNLTRRQNEQSLQFCVDNLRSGYGKAVWKNTQQDLLIYKKLRMFVHAQQTGTSRVQDNQLRVFLRIGQDYTRNYYEYSIPLKITPPASTDENAIWPAENIIDLALQTLIDAKVARNLVGAPVNQRFTVDNSEGGQDRRVTVIGNPDYSDVQSVMIGVLNPGGGTADESKSVCVWVDELRVFDFDKTAGWAAVGRLQTKLADVATVQATGSYTTFGFGALTAKAPQRAREITRQFDVNATIQGDKFLPRKFNLRVPVGVQYGSIVKEPRYDPLDPDTELKQSLKKFGNNAGKRAEYESIVLDRVTTKSLNFLNVRKERGPAPGTPAAPPAPGGAPPGAPKKPKPWDIENFSVSYAYTERLQTNVTTFRDFAKTYTGGIAYGFQTNPKTYTPLGTLKLLDSPYFKFLKDFNFTPLPSSISVRADLDRRYSERFLQRRGSVTELPTPAGIEPVFQKTFYFNRIYDLKWNLTKSLALDYTATNRSVIDEPYGRINGSVDSLQYKNRVIWNNLRRGGRTVSFNQVTALTYRLPLDKFPLTDWLSADARYQAGYTWTTLSTALRVDSLRLGNTIQNNREQSINGKLDLLKLYNKVAFLKEVNNPKPKPVVALGKDGKPLPDPKNTPVGRAAAAAAKAKAKALAEAAVKGGKDPKAGALADTKGKALADTKGKAEADTTKKKPELKLVKAALRALMSVRSVNFQYTLSEGTVLPGYLPGTALFGFSQGFAAPTPQFVLGHQYELGSLYEIAQTRGWYTPNAQNLNTPLSKLMTENLQARANVEPFKNFQIQVEARRQKSRTEEAFYRYAVDDATGQVLEPRQLATVQPFVAGAFSTSSIFVQTLFETTGSGGKSGAFEQFIENRQVIRGKLNEATGRAVTDTAYGSNSQEVLIPALVNAYQGRNAAGYNAKPFNPFSVIPLPNWNVQYNGLSELELVKKYFSSLTLSHGYQGTYSVANYSTSSAYEKEPDGFATASNARGQLIPYYVINTVTIAERLAPLIGINFKTKKNITGRLEYKVERTLALNATNAQVTSVRVHDYVIGAGYTTNRFKLPFKTRGVRKTLNNDLTARLDLTIRDNETVQHTIVRQPNSTTELSQNQTTSGALQIQLKPTVDYVLNQRLNLQFYFTRLISAPKISSSFKNTVTTAGVQLRYSLTQ